MGIRGLQTFLKNNESSLATKTKLSNTSLVIDANNILCGLYAKNCFDVESNQYRNDKFGGDLVHYGRIVREFFMNLEKCKINAILVFDGSVTGKATLKEFAASKERRVHERSLKNFDQAKLYDEFSSGDEYCIPLTLNGVFRKIASEMGVKRVQAPYEADSHIARVANELNCSVLTNDSDFFIYNLNRGFLLLDLFAYERPIVGSGPGETPYIQCALFSQANLARILGPSFEKEVMPLVSMLLGNDYVEAGYFESVLHSISRNNSYYGSLFVARSFNHRRIANLLYWIRNRSLKESIDFILGLIKMAHRPMLEKLIQSFLMNYRIESKDDFDSELEEKFPSDKLDAELIKLKKTPATFLRRHMEEGELGTLALYMAFSNTYYLNPIVDDLTLPSSGNIGYRAFSLSLVLLRRARPNDDDPGYPIYDRVGREYKRIIIKQMDELEGFGSLSDIDCYSMITMSPDRKRRMLMACFRFNENQMSRMQETVARVVSGSFVDEASLCFMLVKYIGLETKVSPKTQFIDALMLTIFYYAALTDNLNKTEMPEKETYAELLLQLEPHTQSNLRISSSSLVHRLDGSGYANDSSLYRPIMHLISQLHCAYLAYTQVNSLLDHACCPANVDSFLNSCLIYRMTKLLRLRKLAVEDLCANLPTLSDVCDVIGAQLNCSRW